MIITVIEHASIEKGVSTFRPETFLTWVHQALTWVQHDASERKEKMLIIFIWL